MASYEFRITFEADNDQAAYERTVPWAEFIGTFDPESLCILTAF